MSRGRVRALAIAGAGLTALGVAIVLSWATTHSYWDGFCPVGEWTVHIRDQQGAPVSGAVARLCYPETGQPIEYGSRLESVFDNYTDSSGLQSDHDGAIHFRNTRRLGFGGEFWDLLWIWRIGTNGESSPYHVVVEVSAANFHPATLSVGDLWDQEQTTVRLVPRVEPTDGT